MAEVSTSNPVNLYQLGLELPGYGLRKVVRSGLTIIKSDAAQQMLEDAVSAHVATDAKPPPDPIQAEAEAERDAARAMIVDLRAYLDLEAPTAAQTRTVVRRLCRTSIRLIRDQYGDS